MQVSPHAWKVVGWPLFVAGCLMFLTYGTVAVGLGVLFGRTQAKFVAIGLYFAEALVLIVLGSLLTHDALPLRGRWGLVLRWAFVAFAGLVSITAIIEGVTAWVVVS